MSKECKFACDQREKIVVKTFDIKKEKREEKRYQTISRLMLKRIIITNSTRTAWAVFKYCGTKTAPLRMKI